MMYSSCNFKASVTNFIRLMSTEMLDFVPKHFPVIESDIKVIENFISNSKQIFVLTGAGISTESGRINITVVNKIF